MAFLETPRFPDSIAVNASGGPRFSNDRATVFSGREETNINWDSGLGEWAISYSARNPTDFALLRDFFRAVRGDGHQFRFKDFTDYTTSGGGIVQLVSGSTYQLYRRYTAGALSEDRKIVKPVAGTIAIQGGGTYSAVDTTTGTFTHTAGAAPTGWTGEYDAPVRFDTDRMNSQMVGKSGNLLMVEWGSIQIVEVRL